MGDYRHKVTGRRVTAPEGSPLAGLVAGDAAWVSLEKPAKKAASAKESDGGTGGRGGRASRPRKVSD